MRHMTLFCCIGSVRGLETLSEYLLHFSKECVKETYLLSHLQLLEMLLFSFFEYKMSLSNNFKRKGGHIGKALEKYYVCIYLCVCA